MIRHCHAARPRKAETDARTSESAPTPALVRPTPTRQTGRKGRLNFLCLDACQISLAHRREIIAISATRKMPRCLGIFLRRIEMAVLLELTTALSRGNCCHYFLKKRPENLHSRAFLPPRNILLPSFLFFFEGDNFFRNVVWTR